MNTYVGASGFIACPAAQAIEIKSIQADVLDASATNVSVTLSGSLGTTYSFGAVTPVVGNFRFILNEQVNVTSIGSINNLVLNYIFYKDTTAYMTQDPGRNNNKRPTPGKWDVS